MGNRTALCSVAALVTANLPSPVAAHHSYINSPFDSCRSASIEGELQEVTWTGPHVWLTVKVDESTVYRVEWVGSQNLLQQGIEPADLPVGGRVAVTGSPHRSSMAISLLTQLRVVDGELNWSRSLPLMSASRDCSPAQ